jgi:integrase
VEFYAKHASQRCDLTVAQLKDEYLAAKQSLCDKGELSAVHLRDMRTRLTKFCVTFGKVKVVEIGLYSTKGMNEFPSIESWLLAFTQANRRNFHTVISGMFNEAVRLEYLKKNPLTKIRKPGVREKPPEIFSVEELTTLLETAARVEPDIVPMLAICAFAGVRSDSVNGEISKLDWSMVNLQEGRIDLSSEITKRPDEGSCRFSRTSRSGLRLTRDRWAMLRR